MKLSEKKRQGDSALLFPEIVNKLKLLGTIRDGVLVCGAIFYAAGYLVWSIHAWLNNMGFLPALDFQYLVAGSVPVLIVVLAYFAGRFLWHFIMKVWPQKVSPEATGGWRIVRLALFLLFYASLYGFIFMAHPSLALVLGFLWVVSVSKIKLTSMAELTKWGKVWRLLGMIAFLALFSLVIIKGNTINSMLFGFVDRIKDHVISFSGVLLLPIVLFLPTPEKDWVARILKVIYFALTLLFFPLIGLTYYALEIYPNLPQELGGVQPRCAHVDVAPKTLSATTRTVLLPDQPNDTTLNVIRSHRLTVLFTNNTYLLVKPATEEQQRESTVYELRKNDLQAITWCE